MQTSPRAHINPQLDSIVREQARFRIEGAGPVSQRRIVPVSDGARQLLAESSSAATEAVRGVLRIVEQAAGGATASSSVDLNGVAFADSDAGHGANAYRAHLDDDTVLQSSLARMGRGKRADQVRILGEMAMSESKGTRANAITGWINVGPAASGALLAHRGIALAGRPVLDEPGLAEAVRVLRHEAQHIVDGTRPGLEPAGVTGMREALAEANSTAMPDLAAARTALGLDGAVSDAALGATVALRPYREYEAALETVLQVAGIEPGSAAARALASQPSAAVAETLVAGVARARGSSTRQARRDIGGEFVAARGARR